MVTCRRRKAQRARWNRCLLPASEDFSVLPGIPLLILTDPFSHSCILLLWFYICIWDTNVYPKNTNKLFGGYIFSLGKSECILPSEQFLCHGHLQCPGPRRCLTKTEIATLLPALSGYIPCVFAEISVLCVTPLLLRR